MDATATPPVTLRALDLGADIVFHSATKYLAGHSDLLAGVLATRAADERWQEIAAARRRMGGVPGAFEAWLLLRGMRTLHLRYERQAANALAIARHFEGRAGIEAVLYPGLESHAGHETAKGQMRGQLRRHALAAGRRRRGRREADCDAHKALRAGDLARRRREPDRAPGDGGGAA